MCSTISKGGATFWAKDLKTAPQILNQLLSIPIPPQHTYQVPGNLDSQCTFIASYGLFSGYAHPGGEALDNSHDPQRITVWVTHSSFRSAADLLRAFPVQAQVLSIFSFPPLRLMESQSCRDVESSTQITVLARCDEELPEEGKEHGNARSVSERWSL